nr:hypothetical protein [uncultured Carboxylicivirga sp.]
MEISIETKQVLVTKMAEVLNDKIGILSKAMEQAIESMQDDTKSSAGDKFETGREMMQIELNNLKTQMAQVKQSQSDLSKINPSIKTDKISFGSLVKTNLGVYFISIAQGKIKLNNNDYYSISLASPIGRILRDKKAGESLSFNGKTLLIEDLI